MRRNKGKIERFLTTLRAKNTKSTYRAGILDFLDFINEIERTDRINDLEGYERLADDYLRADRNYCNDIIEYLDSKEDRPSKTVNVYLAGWKEFLYYYDIEFSKKEQRLMKRKGRRSRTATKDTILTPEMLYRICDHTNELGKTLFLFLSSSGCRIGEALTLEKDDIAWTKPVKILIRGDHTKNQKDRYTFITDEAADHLRIWLDNRDDYIRSSANRHWALVEHEIAPPKEAPEKDNRVFPFSRQTAYWIWGSAVRKAGLKEIAETNRMTLTFHSLRRYFRTRLTGQLEESVIEMLMGHEGYLRDSYLRLTPEQIGEQYLKVEEALQMSSVEAISSRLRRIEDENAELRSMLNEIIIMFDLKERYGYKESLQRNLRKLNL